MNDEFAELNQQLNNYCDIIEELTTAIEKNQFAREIHDTLGHTLTMLIKKLEVGIITCKTDADKTEKELLEAVDIARGGLKEVMRSIGGLAPKKLEKRGAVAAINSLIAGFRQTSGIEIHFSEDGANENITHTYQEVIYTVCKEAITNSVRYGKATRVVIILRLEEDKIKLCIFDNGMGCNAISKDFGLTTMEEKIRTLNGNIKYGSTDEDSGFNVQIELPLVKNL
ncbi:MAG: sensor histidine kinase [Clostridia bacterium]|nr:sensor histidine kinase [Clostridia bacterium]